jgi:hypothetical protein
MIANRRNLTFKYSTTRAETLIRIQDAYAAFAVFRTTAMP